MKRLPLIPTRDRIDESRYERQMLVAEIGRPGQARLLETEVSLCAQGFARTIESAYLERAGVRVLSSPAPAPAPAPVPALSLLDLHHPAPRDLADGALRALMAIRTILTSKP